MSAIDRPTSCICQMTPPAPHDECPVHVGPGASFICADCGEEGKYWGTVPPYVRAEDYEILNCMYRVACQALISIALNSCCEGCQEAARVARKTMRTIESLSGLCEDCPPFGHSTNDTRCSECPRRT